MDMKRIIHIVAHLLVIIGALNWGLVGLFDLNLVTLIFGAMPMVVKVVYILVGVSAVLMFLQCRACDHCKK